MGDFINNEDETYAYANMFDNQTSEPANFIIDKPKEITDDSDIKVVKAHKISYSSDGLIRKYQDNNFGVYQPNFGRNFYKPVVKNALKVKTNKFLISR